LISIIRYLKTNAHAVLYVAYIYNSLARFLGIYVITYNNSGNKENKCTVVVNSVMLRSVA
jgi:hypothetical protein